MLKYNKEKKSIVETSCLKCPICSDELKAKDIVVFEKADGDKRKASVRVEDVTFRRNIFLEMCINEERTGGKW